MLRPTISRTWRLAALGVSLSACGGGGSSTSASASGTSTIGTDGSGTFTSGVDTSDATSGIDGTSATSEMTTTGVDGSTSSVDTGPGECVDADGDTYGENCAPGPDCNDDDDNVWTEQGCVNCLDADGDNTWAGCDQFDEDKPGPDCDDADNNVWTEEGCASCTDADGDMHWVGCDTYDEDKPGPDCDDADNNVFTDEGCANCIDGDGDMVWVGCDTYDEDKTGPDCDDENANVGTQDATEICNGLSENCAGEIDNAPADQMCPPEGVNSPNVSSWLCDPPAPGVDGCKIQMCEEQFFNLDDQISNGCECEGTSRLESLASCSDAPEGYLGVVGEGQQLNNLPLGTIPLIDNGIGAGAEDWYSVDFPEAGNPGVRPQTGSIRVDFAINDGTDYRFQVFRSCNGVPFEGGLATQFGAGAPPAREWWFFDNHTAPINMPVPALYTDNVAWPSKVYIRVFRVQNDGTCNNYRLQVQRVAN